MRRILVTGPVAGLERWTAAAEGVGWEAVPFPLVEVHELPADEVDLGRAAPRRPDWLCVTSGHAVPAAVAAAGYLAEVPCATVGAGAAARLAAVGLRVEIDDAGSAAELARRLAPRLGPGALVLWPRGSLSAELAERLRACGAEVVCPVVYETRERELEGPPPRADAVFFASPSAVRAYLRAAPVGGAEALAIGPTTGEALRAPGAGFERVEILPVPTPEALARRLSAREPAG